MDEWLHVPIAAPSSPSLNPPANPPASPPQWPFAFERWLPWAVALAVAVAWFVSSRRSGDDGEPIQVDGLRVLIVEESANRQNLPSDQSQILTSVPTRELVAKLGGQIRIVDADDSTDAMAAEWKAMRKRITTTPPAVVFAKPRRAVEMALPASVDQFREKLEGFAK
jgi:hypothetical protein